MGGAGIGPSSSSNAGEDTKSENPRLRPIGANEGVEYDESEDASENVELALDVRRKDERPRDEVESAANCATGDEDCSRNQH